MVLLCLIDCDLMVFRMRNAYAHNIFIHFDDDDVNLGINSGGKIFVVVHNAFVVLRGLCRKNYYTTRKTTIYVYIYMYKKKNCNFCVLKLLFEL